MKNKIVLDLYNENHRLTQKISILHNKISELENKFNELRDHYDSVKEQNFGLLQELNQVRELKPHLSPSQTSLPPSQNISLGPSDSISQTHSSYSHSIIGSTVDVELVEQPITRPPDLPSEILWDREDATVDIFVDVSDTNKSRPAMSRSIRNQDGTMISLSQWHKIRSAAIQIVRNVLHPIVAKADALGHQRPYGKIYYKKHWPTKWNIALAKLELREPLLKFYSLHWKAKHVFSCILVSGTGDKTNNEIASDSVLPPNPPQKRKSDSSLPPLHRKKKTANDMDTSTNSNSEVAISTPQTSVVSTIPSIMPITGSITILGLNDKTIDLSGIEVIASYKALHALFTMDPVFKNTPYSVDLLKSLYTHSQLTGTDIQMPQPSPAAQEFLTRIQTADPNDPDIGEDTTDSSWGHSQFRSGIVCFNNIVWEDVANSQMAYDIIAATVKTCLVARHLCFKRNLKATSYLADMYLSTIIEWLWEHWKPVDSMDDITVPPSSPVLPPTVVTLANSSIDQVVGHENIPELVNPRSKLQNLFVPELKAWTARYAISVPTSKKNPTKDEYINAIIAASRMPANEDLQNILQGRKEKSSSKH